MPKIYVWCNNVIVPKLGSVRARIDPWRSTIDFQRPCTLPNFCATLMLIIVSKKVFYFFFFSTLKIEKAAQIEWGEYWLFLYFFVSMGFRFLHWEIELVCVLKKIDFWPLAPNFNNFWSKSEHYTFQPNIIILILYYSHKGFEYLWDINKYSTLKSYYHNKTSAVVYIRLILWKVGHLPFAVDRPPSRNCPLNPTTKLHFCGARRAKPAVRRPPPLTLF